MPTRVVRVPEYLYDLLKQQAKEQNLTIAQLLELLLTAQQDLQKERGAEVRGQALGAEGERVGSASELQYNSLMLLAEGLWRVSRVYPDLRAELNEVLEQLRGNLEALYAALFEPEPLSVGGEVPNEQAEREGERESEEAPAGGSGIMEAASGENNANAADAYRRESDGRMRPA